MIVLVLLVLDMKEDHFGFNSFGVWGFQKKT